MTSSLAVRIKEEDSATGCTAPADLVTYVDSCVEMDGEVLGEFIECNWDQVAGNALGLMHLVWRYSASSRILTARSRLTAPT